jgi:phosphoglycolate phosphatase-like HAD superfamily hydrolase
MRKFVLFDIDGTLIDPGGAGVKSGVCRLNIQVISFPKALAVS